MINKYEDTSSGLMVIRSLFAQGDTEQKKDQSQKTFFSVEPKQKGYNYCGEFSPYINFICSQGENSHIKLQLSPEKPKKDSKKDSSKAVIDFGEEEEIEREMEEEENKQKEEAKKYQMGKKKFSSKKK